MDIEKAKANAKALLFVSFNVSPSKALTYINDMEKSPEKTARYTQVLTKGLVKLHESFSKMTHEVLEAKAVLRTEEWNRVMGSVSIQEVVTMSMQWDISVNLLLNKLKKSITPEVIKEMLDVFVMGQEDYKIKLSVAFFTYLMHLKRAGMLLPKSNLLVCGPSGSGKTYGMYVLGKLFHVPFVTIHCNSLVQEGIIGPTLTDGFAELYSQGWNASDMEHAIVCFDEFDKLFERNRAGGDSGHYNSRVVNEMLNIIDDKGEVEFRHNLNDRSDKRIKVPTRKMMFVFTGVFNGLRNHPGETEEASNQTKAKKRIGFKSDELIEENDEPTIDDFVEFGVKPEILGRVQNFVFLDALTEDELVALFDMGTYSPFNEFEQYFSFNGINTIMTDEGKRALARLACERKLGVRGLKSLLQQVLMEDMYDLDVGEDRILKVTEAYINENLRKH